MHVPGRPRRRRPWLPIVIAAAAVAVVIAIALARPWAEQEPLAAGTDAAAPPVAPLVIPEDPRVLVFGDSWVYGSAASDPRLGFAYLLADRVGGQTIVDGVRGSGYLKPGIDGPSYGERIAALDPDLDPDIVIVEGSINDRRLYPEGYRDAVVAAWDALAAIYPEASVVILGPAPQVLPVERPTARIDADLADLAAARGWWYLSPIAEEWITAENYLDVIDTGAGRDHPSTAGHAYLADRLADALRRLTGAPTVIAGEVPSTPVPAQ